MTRNRAYYRHHRKRTIKNKMKVVKSGYWYVKPGTEGRLSKGKVHCSCSSCSQKVSNHGYKKNDQSKLNSMSKDIKHFFDFYDTD